MKGEKEKNKTEKMGRNIMQPRKHLEHNISRRENDKFGGSATESTTTTTTTEKQNTERRIIFRGVSSSINET